MTPILLFHALAPTSFLTCSHQVGTWGRNEPVHPGEVVLLTGVELRVIVIFDQFITSHHGWRVRPGPPPRSARTVQAPGLKSDEDPA